MRLDGLHRLHIVDSHDQEVIVIGAEGIDESGKGVLRMSMEPFSSAGTIGLDSDKDAASVALRAPVDALEMAGFSHQGKDTVVLLTNKACASMCRAKSTQDNDKI